MPRPTAWDSSFEQFFNAGIAGNPTTDTLRIPDYQRDYSWPRSLVEQLYEDLSEYRQDTPIGQIPDSPYYLGNLVIHENNNIWDIVDGQQRITALTLLTTALRDTALDNELYSLGAEIHSVLIASNIWSGHYLDAKCEDPVGNWANVKKHENRATIRFYQHFFKDHVDYEIEYIGNAMGAQVGVAQLEISPVKARFPISIPTVASHPTIDFGNNITFIMQSKDPLHPNHGGTPTISAGDQIEKVFGTLNIPAGQNLNPGDIGRVKSIENQQNWWNGQFGPPPTYSPAQTTRVPKAYWKLKNQFKDDIDGMAPALMENRLQHWFTVIRNLAFTITKFDELEAAVFHFEKMNDKSYSLSLDAGDLMRREKVVRAMKANTDNVDANGLGPIPPGFVVPAGLGAAEGNINASWASIQDELVTGEFNEIGDFLRAMHISTGNNVTSSKTFREHKNVINDRITNAKAAVVVPAGATPAQQNQGRIEKMNAEHEVVTNWFETSEILSQIFRQIAQPNVASVAELHRVELKNLTRAGFKQQWSLFLRGKYVIEQNKAEFMAGPVYGAMTAANQATEAAAWDELFPRLIRIYEYLVIRGVIFPADLQGGGVASNVIYSKVAEWCGSLYGLPNPATRADIEGVLDTISTDVVDLCSGFRWLSPVYSAMQDAAAAANAFLGVAGATPANVETALNALQLPDYPGIANIIQNLATNAGNQPNLASAIALVNAAVPARSIDLRYLDLQINSAQACLLLSIIEISRRGVTWAASAAAGGVLFQTEKEVEHIFPQKAQTGPGEAWGTWNGVGEEEIESYKNRLGNLTLIGDVQNRSLGRKSFADKQTEPNNGYDANAAANPVGGQWQLLNELRSAVQADWLQADIDSRTEIMLGELFAIYDPAP